MKNVSVFLMAALPCIMVGLALAVLFVRGAKKKKEEKSDDYSTEGMCLGMCLGTALGTALGNNSGIGISLGLLLGLVIGSCIKKGSRMMKTIPRIRESAGRSGGEL